VRAGVPGGMPVSGGRRQELDGLRANSRAEARGRRLYGSAEWMWLESGGWREGVADRSDPRMLEIVDEAMERVEETEKREIEQTGSA